jgi:hypothetical protein
MKQMQSRALVSKARVAIIKGGEVRVVSDLSKTD